MGGFLAAYTSRVAEGSREGEYAAERLRTRPPFRFELR